MKKILYYMEDVGGFAIKAIFDEYEGLEITLYNLKDNTSKIVFGETYFNIAFGGETDWTAINEQDFKKLIS